MYSLDTLDSTCTLWFASCMTQQVTYISTSDVARRFGVDRSAVSRWVTSGKLEPALTTPGGHHKFDPAVVEGFIAESAVTSRSQARSA